MDEYEPSEHISINLERDVPMLLGSSSCTVLRTRLILVLRSPTAVS